MLYQNGIILNKHNTDNQAVTYHFNFIFNGNEYILYQRDFKLLGISVFMIPFMPAFEKSSFGDEYKDPAK